MSRATDFVDTQLKNRLEKGERINRPSIFSLFTKRFFDIAGSLIGLLLLSPVFAFIALRIKKDTPGPVYYRGPRAGLRGKVFQIYKFRTMYERPESYTGAPVTGKGDLRITPFGRWLRDSKINELPQLLNVLRGEMSLVGPRPEDPDIASGWPEEIRNEILSMRPGITSPASVLYRNEENMLASANVMDDYLLTILPDKLRLDQLYVRNYSFFGDIDVIFMTLTLILPIWRDAKVPERKLFTGSLAWFMQKIVSWFAIDTITAFIAISLVVLIWRASAPLDIGFVKMLVMAILLALGLALTNTLFGVNKITWRYASPVHVIDLAVSTALALFIFWMIWTYAQAGKLPSPMLLDFGIIAFVGFVAVRYRERLITGIASRWLRWRNQTSKLGERVLVIGAGDCGQLAIWLLEKSRLSSVFSVVGFIDDDYRKVDQRINGLPVLGTMQDLPRIAEKKSIGLVMFAINKISPEARDRIVDDIKELPVRLLMIPDLLTVLSDYFSKQAKKEES